MVFSYGYGDNKIDDNNSIYDCHADVAMGCRAHRPVEHIPGLTRNHRMPPLGTCSHRIAAAAGGCHG
jgi:hypothetical protein